MRNPDESVREAVDARPMDQLKDLMVAVQRLQDCFSAMGATIEPVEIVLRGGGSARNEFEYAIKSSPSYVQLARYTNEKPTEPHVICEVMGVMITHRRV
jgi:hypothetical protein